MYTNYYPYTCSSSYQSYPYQYETYSTSPQMMYKNQGHQSGDRFIAGGFLAPFLLGGLAGAAIARPYGFGGGYGYGYPMYPGYGYPCCGGPRFW